MTLLVLSMIFFMVFLREESFQVVNTMRMAFRVLWVLHLHFEAAIQFTAQAPTRLPLSCSLKVD